AHAVGRAGAALVEPTGRAIATSARARDAVAAVPGPTSTADSYRASSARASAAKTAPQPMEAAPFTGGGFDTCSAPSARAMNAWEGSPYRAIGVYIGGANSACAQPN